MAAVYAVDDDSEQNVEADLVRLDQFLKEIVGKLEEPKEGDEIDSKSAIKELEAFGDVVARRPKRSWAERKEKKRLIEIDALVEKLWADKDKQANGEATDTPVTEQKEQSDTEHEVKAPRRNGARPRFESSSEHPHDRRKSKTSKNERKQAKMDEPKTVKHEEAEEDSGEHSIHAEKADDTEKVPDVAKEVKNRRLEKPKKTFTKNQRKEDSDEDHSTESVNENEDAGSAASDLQDSSSTISRKLPSSVESDLVESDLATDAPQESFVSDPASSALPAPVDPAAATSADSKSIASDDASSVDSVHSNPIATVSPVFDASEDSIPDASADSVPAAAFADPVLAAAADPMSFVSANTVPAASADSDPIATADPTSSASTGAPDDDADEEETSARPTKSTNLDQTRLKRQVSLVTESAKDGKTPKQVKQKPTGLLDRLVAAANSTVSRKEKSNIEPKSKAPAEDRTDQRSGSATRKGYPDEKTGEQKKLKSEKKDEQTNIKADKDDSGKAQNSATHVRTDARIPVKQQVPVPLLTPDVGKTGSGDMKQARILQTKYKSQSVATTSPKNGKTNAKKPSASATHGVPNEEKTPAASEADTVV